jgi:hypothetical protein
MAQQRRSALRARSPARQVQDHLGEIRGSGPGGLTGKLAQALLAKKSLDTTKQVEEPFPEDYFTGAKPIDDEARLILRGYEQRLQDFREQLLARNTTFTIHVAQGVSVWITSIHTLVYDDLRAQGLELWGRLLQGEENVEEAYRMLLRRDVTDVERIYMQFRPTVLVSTEHRAPRMTVG